MNVAFVLSRSQQHTFGRSVNTKSESINYQLQNKSHFILLLKCHITQVILTFLPSLGMLSVQMMMVHFQ